MPRIYTYSIDDLCHDLPPAEVATSDDLASFDVLFTSLGFEDRSVAVSQRLANPPKHTYLLLPSTNADDNLRNLPELKARYDQPGCHYVELHAEKRDTSVILEELFAGKTIRSGELRCALDISVMPSRFMLPLMNRLIESDTNLTVLYTMPESYKPSKEDFEGDIARFCESLDQTTEVGVGDLISSLSLPGQHVDQLPAKLVLFPNFRRQRSMAVMSDVDESLAGRSTDQLIWFLTKPLNNSFLWRLDAIRKINGITESCRCMEIEPLDYRDTILNLERVYSECWRTHNLSISPLGTKMQRLGIALFEYCRPSTRLIYSRPVQYNAKTWSEGVSNIYAVRLGDTRHLRERLLDLGALRVRD